MEIFATMVYVGCRPFVEFKDNVLGVMTNLLVLLVMLTALLRKRNEGGGGAEEGIGRFLIFMNVLCLVVFVAFGDAQAHSYKHDFDNDTKTTKGLALGVLKRQATGDDDRQPPPQPRGEPGVDNDTFDTLRQQIGIEDGIEMTENPMIKKEDQGTNRAFNKQEQSVTVAEDV
jgi:hypothetical protein